MVSMTSPNPGLTTRLMRVLRSLAAVSVLLAGGGQPASAAARPAVVQDSLFAPSLGVWKRVVIVLPVSYDRNPDQRYPVAYYLHGLTGNERDWTARARLDSTAAALVDAGSPETIVVMPDGDDSWYLNWITAEPYARCAAEVRSEPAAEYCVKQAGYADYIAHDVVSHVDTHYRTRAERAHRGIAGLSMGGYGAIKIALQYPTIFAAAASHSGVVAILLVGFAADGSAIYARDMDDIQSLNRGYRSGFVRALGGDVDRWRSNDPGLLAAERMKDGRMPAIYIDCGTDDSLITQNRALHRELTQLGVVHEYNEYPGAHTWSYWRAHGGQSLDWMARRIQ